MQFLDKIVQKRLGDILIHEEIITAEQLKDCLREQERTGALLGEILVNSGLATEWDIARAISKQYQKYFELEKVRLKFTDEALVAIAKAALKRGTGARGLRAILEEVMLDVMYELPALEGLKECIVTKEVIASRDRPIMIYEKQAESA